MRRFLAITGFAAFGLSAIVHALTFFGIDPMMTWPQLWGLHVVAMIVGASTVFRLRGVRRADIRRDPYRETFDAIDMDVANIELEKITTGTEREREEAERELVRRLRPNPLAVTVACLGIYAFVNFGVSISLLDGGVPEQQGDSFQLISHGKILRDLTPSEFRWHRAYQTRLATGAWMFLLFAAGALWTTPRIAARSRRTA